MMIPAVRRHNLVVKILLVGFMTVALLMGIAILLLGSAFGANVTDRTGDWPAFYKESVDGAFNIPREAKILLAEEYRDSLMGGGYLVSFRLPETKKPEQWLEAIVKDGPLANYKVTKYRYDGSFAVSDVYWIEYRPADRTYVARWHWD